MSRQLLYDDNEEWRDVPEWPGYMVSSAGRVKRLACCMSGRQFGERLLTVHRWIDHRGHKRLYVRLDRRCVGEPGKGCHRTIGRLVLLAFVGYPKDGEECRHLNDDYLDCSLENLRWGTHKQNSEDAVSNGKIRKGSRSGAAKLSEDVVLEIRQSYVFGSRRFGAAAFARKFGVSSPTVLAALGRRTWKHV